MEDSAEKKQRSGSEVDSGGAEDPRNQAFPQPGKVTSAAANTSLSTAFLADGEEDPQQPVNFDLESPLEKFFEAMMGAGGVGVVWAGLFLLGKDPPFNPWTQVALFAILWMVFSWLRKKTDCYYQVDPRTRTIQYHFRFLWLESTRPCLGPEQIVAVTTAGAKFRDKSHSWYEYWVCVLDRDGWLTALSDYSLDLDQQNLKAAGIARLLEARFVPSPNEAELEVVRGKKTFFPRHVKNPVNDSFSMGCLLQFLHLGKLLLVLLGTAAILYLLNCVDVFSHTQSPEWAGFLMILSLALPLSFAIVWRFY